MSKKFVYKVGDIVQVVTPFWVDRVGYPLSKKDVMKRLNDTGKLEEFYNFINHFVDDVYPSKSVLVDINSICANKMKTVDALQEFLNPLIYLIQLNEKFGGNNREIYTTKRSSTENSYFKIVSKKVVKTGNRVDGNSQKAILKNQKSHVLLELTPYDMNHPDIFTAVCNICFDRAATVNRWANFIEEKNVKLIEREYDDK